MTETLAPAWGKKGAWADDEPEAAPEPPQPAAQEPPSSDFPSLSDAAKNPQPKGKANPKKKGQRMDIRTFMQQAPGPAIPTGPTPKSEKEILLSLPTGSRGKLEGEEEDAAPGRLGGAFRDYGGDRGERRGRRGPDDEEYMPSRADEVRDWGSTRKFQPSSDDGPRGGRGFGGGFSSRSRERPVSAADEVDSWGTTKKFEPSSSSLGGGFRDRDAPPARRGMFEGHSKADEEEQWSRRGPPPAPEGRERSRGRERSGFGFSGEPGRNPDAEERWGRRAPSAEGPPSANGAAPSQPAERPRLKLAPRTAPVEKPPSPGPAEQAPPQPKKEKSNPFGAAKPREEVLREKGVDANPMKEVLKLEQGEVLREETPKEKELQREVTQLRTELESFKIAGEEESDGAVASKEELDTKETALLKLKVELDDKQRYARKKESEAAAASGSQADRPTSSSPNRETQRPDAPPREEERWGRREQPPPRSEPSSGGSGEPRPSAAPGSGPARGSGKW